MTNVVIHFFNVISVCHEFEHLKTVDKVFGTTFKSAIISFRIRITN